MEKMICLILISILFSCSQNKKVEVVQPKNLELDKLIKMDMKSNDEYRNLVINFFNWYKSNENLHEYRFLKGGIITDQDSTAYYIDMIEVDKYINEFEKTNFVSHSYMNKIKKHLKKVSKDLILNKVYDGPIVGLDHDIITQSQDDYDLFKNISKIKLINSKIESKDDFENYYQAHKHLKIKVNFTYEDGWKINDYSFF